MATGGVTPENTPDFFAAGVQVVGTSPTLMPVEAVEREDYERITQLARVHITAVRKGQGRA